MNTMRLFRMVLLAVCFSPDLNAQKLGVVVPDAPPSRDAHFNWEFASSGGGKAEMGQFACGSHWVAPAAGDKSVKVLSLTGHPGWNDLLSCDADPVVESHGLLDGSNKYGSHNASENIIPKLPITFTPRAGSCVSLVAVMQRNEKETSQGGTKAILGEVADAYCVVTVLPSVPKDRGAGMIRPNITGETKEFLTWDDFDLGRLPVYDFLPGMDPVAGEKAQLTWRSSIEIFGLEVELEPGKWKLFSEGGRAYRAQLLIDDYASGMAELFNRHLLFLLSDKTNPEVRKQVLAAMLAFGLDLYHARYDHGERPRTGWSSGAGQASGKFMSTVLLAALQRDGSKADELRKVAINNHGNDRGELGPQELRQLNRGVTGVLLWGDGTPIVRKGNELSEIDWRYWSELKASHCFDSAVVKPGQPNTGKKTIADPYGYIDGPANMPGSAYMGVSYGPIKSFAAIMLLVPGIRSVVNTDDPIEYSDRLTRHGLWTLPDPVAAPSETDQTNNSTTYMKVVGCVDWGTKWGPNPKDVRFAIEDGKGRFPSLHGTPMKGGYPTRSVVDHWDKMIARYDGDRFERNAVELGVLVSPEILFETGPNPRAHMKCPNPDAEIRYTLDGSDPTAKSPLYENPVPVKPETEVRAKAFQAGKTDSSIRRKRYPSP